MDWEEKNLRRENVENGLKIKCAAGALSADEFDKITAALTIPKKTPKSRVVKAYRDRLMHHIRPSVDYSRFFSAVESRVGKEIKDDAGNIIAREHLIGAIPPAEHKYEDLHAAFSEYLDAVVEMLQSLSGLEPLRR